MRASRRTLDDVVACPFHTAEEAWLWTMETLLARRDGADLAWRPEGPPRPCDPEDVVRCLDTLYRRRSVVLPHVRILRIWGERQTAPCSNPARQLADWRLWHQALAQLEWLLRARGIVH